MGLRIKATKRKSAREKEKEKNRKLQTAVEKEERLHVRPSDTGDHSAGCEGISFHQETPGYGYESTVLHGDAQRLVCVSLHCSGQILKHSEGN